MVEYDSAEIYIQSKTTLREKIAVIDAIISTLEATALKSAGTDNQQEYWFDDGQTKIKLIYTGASAVFRAIQDFERLRQMYVNRLNGRMVRLVDGKNFIRNRNNR
jgi:hypothetical protein